MRRHITRHRGLHHQPRVPGRVRKQPGLHVVHPVRAGGHDSACLQRLPAGGQVRLPGNQRDGRTEHMVRHFSLVCLFVFFHAEKTEGCVGSVHVIHQVNAIHLHVHLRAELTVVQCTSSINQSINLYTTLNQSRCAKKCFCKVKFNVSFSSVLPKLIVIETL